MRISPFLLFFILPTASSYAQKQQPNTPKKNNRNTVAYISTEEVDDEEDNIHEKASNKEKPVVVYGSKGVHSEDITKKLMYWDISFMTLMDLKLKEVYTFSKFWGDLLTNATKYSQLNKNRTY
ncbi:hypothetical protein LV716_10425 [Flagellimonas sp. HMM57]|uniref:hypothetical protein n=1 Tax=unclassified Flagellimonas TaxID=2644544 RepID=UPI0013D1F7E4|nr:MULTISPECIES: hypothetical protein [unclassified Flagellimonas]UII74683.1 hypothetical protein LV716_10425 [Flagellimonas sp. HMM57]